MTSKWAGIKAKIPALSYLDNYAKVFAIMVGYLIVVYALACLLLVFKGVSFTTAAFLSVSMVVIIPYILFTTPTLLIKISVYVGILTVAYNIIKKAFSKNEEIIKRFIIQDQEILDRETGEVFAFDTAN